MNKTLQIGFVFSVLALPMASAIAESGSTASTSAAITSSVEFDGAFYLYHNSDVAADPGFSKNPLSHYQTFGKNEARRPNASALRERYRDNRPIALKRLEAEDVGSVLKPGGCPGECDKLGARDVTVFEDGGHYFMHYDGAGPSGWLTSLAKSDDLLHWQKQGAVLDLGKQGEPDSASASAAWPFFDGQKWHAFYLCTPNAGPAPNFLPMFPYQTCKAVADGPSGPWRKEPEVKPFRPILGTYYSVTASPGYVVKSGSEYLMFFSAASDLPILRTLSIARTTNLEQSWRVDKTPILPQTEQIENSSLYFEKANGYWFLFTNHIGVDNRDEYTDAVWVYWSKDLNRWDPQNKAVVLDNHNTQGNLDCVGMPSVIPFQGRLAVFYDSPGGWSIDHMNREVRLAWLNLPLNPPPR